MLERHLLLLQRPQHLLLAPTNPTFQIIEKGLRTSQALFFSSLLHLPPMNPNNDIRKYSVEQLSAEFEAMGEPKFRARQVHEWLWKKSARSFEEMTNLSKELRTKLAEQFSFYSV